MAKGIYSRGFLPHWDFEKSTQAITFRLTDSVPAEVIDGWRNELASMPDEKLRALKFYRLISHYEDAGHGEAVLSDSRCAAILQRKFIDGHSKRYSLIDWCIMPNHVHVLVKLEAGHSLAEIVKFWKGGSAVEINRILSRTGTLWQREYYDRFGRDLGHLHDCMAYIRNNPTKAKLCDQPEDWPFSSAGVDWETER